MKSELGEALRALRRALWSAAILSGVINVMMLTGSIFMLALYDRVIPSSSMPTLVGLCVMVLFAYGFMALLESLRLRILSRIGSAVQESFGVRTYDIIIRSVATGRGQRDAWSALRDFDNVRGFLSGLGMTAIFDLPWLPIFLVICFLFHPLIGLTALIGSILLVVIAIWSERSSQAPTKELSDAMNKRQSLVTSSQANAETIQAMGMTPGLSRLWRDSEKRILDGSLVLADQSGAMGSISRQTRALLQSMVLAVGAYLVINHLATGGIMIAGSILAARAMAPIDTAIAHWRSFVQARQSWARLGELYKNVPVENVQAMPPIPSRQLTVENVSVTPPGAPKPVVLDVSFARQSGSALGIIGPSGSGKSTLARALVGIWAPQWGQIRYDGALLNQWPSSERGRFIGYLAQDVSLFEGTIAQNIARFDPNATMEKVLRAANMARVHDLIVSLPGGYDTVVSDGNSGLSGGQRQRLGLARALYGDPFLVVLDEPNSNLDNEGEMALLAAITDVRARGGVVVLIAHRPNLLAVVDDVLVLNKGRVQAFGTRDEILARMAQRPQAGQAAPQSRPAAAAGS